MKVAVLTDFTYLPPQYGLVPVVQAQLDLLLKHNVETTLIVMEGFKNDKDAVKIPKEVKVVQGVPFMHLFDYALGTPEQENAVGPIGEPPSEGVPAKTNMKKQVALTTEYLEQCLPGHDAVITHDILYQTWKIPINQAVRNVGEKHPDIKWIHWCHSAPQPRPDIVKYPDTLRFTPMPNSVWVAPNQAMASGFAKQYNVGIDRVKVVYHAVDLAAFYGLHPMSVELIEKHDLLSPEVLIVMPTRLDHYKGKRIDKIALLAAQLNKMVPTKLLYLNSWSSDERSKAAVADIRGVAEKNGMDAKNVIFSSDMGKGYASGVPRQVVKDMLMIANVFIMASESETFSLITAEAALTKNLLVLNDDLEMMHELYDGNARYVPFGSDWGGLRTSRNYAPNEESFMADRAKDLLDELHACKPLMAHRHALRTFTEKYIWEHQLRLLLEG